MGIDTDWKAKLAEMYPDCWTNGLPDGVSPIMVIDDLSLNCRKVTTGAKTGEEMITRLINRIDSLGNPKLEKRVIIFDEGEYTPLNKQITQKKRTDDNKKNPPFTPKEIRDNFRGINEGRLPIMERFMATRSLQPELYRFFTKAILNWSSKNAYVKKPEIVIDGGVIEVQDREKVSLKSQIIVKHPGYDFPTFYESSKIGESDVKIVRYVNSVVEGDILVCSYDTDLIPILLLSVRDWIGSSGEINKRVFLDLSPSGFCTHKPGGGVIKQRGGEVQDPKDNKRQMLDMVLLWRSIIEDFNMKFPFISDPIEIIVTLMMMSGTDYVETIYGIRCNKIWNAFEDIGNSVMYLNEPLLITDKKWSVDVNEIHSIILAEHKMYQWIAVVFYHVLFGKPDNYLIFSFDQISIREYRKKFKIKVDTNLGKNETDRSTVEITMDLMRDYIKDRGMKYKLHDDFYLMGFIRRIGWNLDYISNSMKYGGSKDHPFNSGGSKDPLQIDRDSSLSVHGWTFTEKFEEGVKKVVVLLAPIVHRYTYV